MSKTGGGGGLSIYMLHTFVPLICKTLSGAKSALCIYDYYDVPVCATWQNIHGYRLHNKSNLRLLKYS